MEAFDLAEFDVFVFDVDRHVGVYAFQRVQEPRPEGGVVDAADGSVITIDPASGKWMTRNKKVLDAEWKSGLQNRSVVTLGALNGM